MAVKISSLSSGSLKGIGSNDAVERADRTSTASSSISSNSSQDDSVNLTVTAAQLQQLESRISKMSVVDAQLVQEVQHKLATGSFRVDPESAATKLLTMEATLP